MAHVCQDFGERAIAEVVDAFYPKRLRAELLECGYFKMSIDAMILLTGNERDSTETDRIGHTHCAFIKLYVQATGAGIGAYVEPCAMYGDAAATCVDHKWAGDISGYCKESFASECHCSL